ncbi:MAG TPA: 3-dehydroquinate synthase [Terrimicrobiaceae bacterium]
MVARVPVSLAGKPYESIVGNEILSRTGEFVRAILPAGSCAVVTDSNVGPLYAQAVARSLQGAGFTPIVITIPAGEGSKSLAIAETICDEMITAGLDRGGFVAALGGGVIGDLAGFVASIYYRGIPHVQMPTTVVAQVDSAIGGKTGVNARGGKNLIGSFHQPALVIADPAVLSTLPKREFNEGIAEVIKHAVIRDAKMLDDLTRVAAFDLPSLIARNQQIKARIVSEDEFEKLGLRALLNFGHTIGHAIENAAGYGRFLHGEAVSLGIAAALDLSVDRAGLPIDQAEIVLKSLSAFDLPVKMPHDIPTHALMKALGKDKKFEAGAIRFVLTKSLGSAFVSREVTEGDVRRAIENLKEPK